MPDGLYGLFSQLVDDVTILFCCVVEEERGFLRTAPGPPPTIDALIDDLRVRPPEVRWPGDPLELVGRGERLRVPVEAPSVAAGAFFDFLPARSGWPADTLVVYHHGLGEIPHHVAPRAMSIGGELGERCDWIAIKGFHHETMRTVSLRLTSDRNHFMGCLLGTAAITRRIARALRPRYRHLVLCGISLGGVIAQLEASREPCYDLYVPFVSGPDLADVLTRSAFARTVASGYRRHAAEAGWIQDFDLTERLAACPGPPIRPLLGRSDQLFRCERQAAAYARVPRAQVATFPGGHITGAMSVRALGRHLERALQAERWGRGVGAPAAPGPVADGGAPEPLAAVRGPVERARAG